MRKLRVWPGVVISLVLVAMLTHGIDLQRMLSALKSVSALPLAGAVIALCSTQWIKSWRWKYLLASVRPISAAGLLPPTVIGAMADMIFPARIGEFVRAFLTGRKHQVSVVASLATILVEKIFDISILLLIVMCLVVFSTISVTTTLPSEFVTGMLVVGTVLVLVASTLACFAAKTPEVTKYTGSKLRFLPATWLDRLNSALRCFAAGIRSVNSVRVFIPVVLLSLLLWATYASSNFLILQAFELELPVYASFVFLVFQILGVTLPSSPGFIGTYHAAVVAGFHVFEVTREEAVSVAVVMHAAFFIPFLVLGALFLWREDLSLNALWVANQEQKLQTDRGQAS